MKRITRESNLCKQRKCPPTELSLEFAAKRRLLAPSPTNGTRNVKRQRTCCCLEFLQYSIRLLWLRLVSSCRIGSGTRLLLLLLLLALTSGWRTSAPYRTEGWFSRKQTTHSKIITKKQLKNTYRQSEIISITPISLTFNQITVSCPFLHS